MPIAGVLILTEPKLSDKVLVELNTVKNITTYGIHKNNHIVAVIEADSIEELERVAKLVTTDIQGVIGVYPTYVNYEELEEE